MGDAAPAAPAPSAPAPSSNGASGSQTAAGDATPAPAGGAPSGTPAVPAAKPDATPPQRYKLKVRGEDRDVSLDALLMYGQRGLGADEEFREAARLRKESEERAKAADSWKERAKKDPWGLLREAGTDPDEAARRYVLEKYGAELGVQGAPPQETPRERELREKLASYEDKERQAAEAAQREAYEKHHRAGLEKYRTTFTGALSKLGVPAADPMTPVLVARMALLEEQNISSGYDAPPEVLAEVALEDMRAEHRLSVRGLEGDALLSHLGDEVVTRVVNAAVAKFKAARAATAPAAAEPQKPAADRSRDSSGRFAGAAESREAAAFKAFIGR